VSTTSTAVPPASAGSSSAPASSPATAAASPSAAGTDTYLAEGQDLNGPLLHRPICGGYGCGLSGDSTAFLFQMTWTAWSGTVAVGLGTYRLNDCEPNCATGHVYSVSTQVILSQPVKACFPSGIRWVFSRAAFTFPDGLPKALQGQNAPLNPWTFSALITAAQQSCAT
jgi:hypothetical protein